MGRLAARAEPGKARLHRRNLDVHQHGAALWPWAERTTRRRHRTTRTLEDQHLRRCSQARPDHRTLRVFDGPINGAAFTAWIEQALAPTLHAGDIVILDNLSSHKVAGIKQAIEARGAKLVYLPPYSPDLNPIEQVFAKLKHLLRKASARTVDALHDAIGSLLDAFSPAECQNYINNSGYSN